MVAQTQGQQVRGIARVVHSIRTLEGGGFMVRRPFPTSELDLFDPFLLLDEMGPTQVAPGEAKGAPGHPHRGFETVTYMLSGAMQHKDSAGNHGTLQSGDVQWMTAGAGVMHSELPTDAFQKTGGVMHGFQLWVNLPKRDKMMQPRYQDVPNATIPVAHSDDGKVKVKIIAGEAYGKRAVIDTRTPIFYLHYTLQPGAEVIQSAPSNHNAFIYVVDGGVNVAGTEARGGDMVIFDGRGDVVKMSVPADAKAPVDVLLLGGVPLKEPVARYGPFVMNTRSEIIQAVEDFQSGRMGSIA